MNGSAAIAVLVVDDERSVRDSLVNYLGDWGYAVTGAGSAEEALVTSENMPLDVAVVDLRLPGMSGERLILELHKTSPGTRFLIHTGSVEYRPSEALQRIGVRAEHVFTKPQPDLHRFVNGIQALVEERS